MARKMSRLTKQDMKFIAQDVIMNGKKAAFLSKMNAAIENLNLANNIIENIHGESLKLDDVDLYGIYSLVKTLKTVHD